MQDQERAANLHCAARPQPTNTAAGLLSLPPEHARYTSRPTTRRLRLDLRARLMATPLFFSRLGVVALTAAALACSLRAPDVTFTALEFHKLGLLLILLFWHLPRLAYDAARAFAGVPLPPWSIALTALVVAEWAVMLVLLAAASSATAVLVFFRFDSRSCMPVRAALPGACSHWHVAAAALNLAAWFLSAIVSGLMFWLRVSIAEAELAE